MRTFAAVLVLLVAVSPALAEPLARLAPGDIAALPAEGAVAGTSGLAGVTTTVLAGDPTRSGPYTIRLCVPAHTTIRPHTHRDDRASVVVSGTWWFGYGAKADEAVLKALPTGSFYTEPAGQPHFARTGDDPVVVYITGFGPTDTRYVNPADDPHSGERRLGQQREETRHVRHDHRARDDAGRAGERHWAAACRLHPRALAATIQLGSVG